MLFVVSPRPTTFSKRLQQYLTFKKRPFKFVSLLGDDGTLYASETDQVLLLWPHLEPDVFQTAHELHSHLTVVLFDHVLPAEFRAPYTLVVLCSQDHIWRQIEIAVSELDSGVKLVCPPPEIVKSTKTWTLQNIYTHTVSDDMGAFGLPPAELYHAQRATSTHFSRAKLISRLVPSEKHVSHRQNREPGPFCISGYHVQSTLVRSLEDFVSRPSIVSGNVHGTGFLFSNCFQTCYESIYHAIEDSRVPVSEWHRSPIDLYVAGETGLASQLRKAFGFTGLALDVPSASVGVYLANQNMPYCQGGVVCAIQLKPVPCVSSIVLQSVFEAVHTRAQVRTCLCWALEPFCLEQLTRQSLSRTGIEASEVSALFCHQDEDIPLAVPRYITQFVTGNTGIVSALCSIGHALYRFEQGDLYALINDMSTQHVQIMLERMYTPTLSFEPFSTVLILSAHNIHELQELAQLYLNIMTRENFAAVCLSSCTTRERKACMVYTSKTTFSEYRLWLNRVRRGIVHLPKKSYRLIAINFDGEHEVKHPLLHNFQRMAKPRTKMSMSYAWFRFFQLMGIRFDVYLGQGPYEVFAAVACGAIPFARINEYYDESPRPFAPFMSTKLGVFLIPEELGPAYWNYQGSAKKEASDVLAQLDTYVVHVSKLRSFTDAILACMDIDALCGRKVEWWRIFNSKETTKLPYYPFPTTHAAVALIGCGGHFHTVIGAINSMAVSGVFTSNEEEVGTVADEHLVQHLDEMPVGRFHVCIGDNAQRRRITETLVAHGHTPVSIIHPQAVVRGHVEPGCFVGAHAVVEDGAIIQAHCIIQAGAIVHHHVRVEKYAFVGANAVLMGRSVIAEGAFLGGGVLLAPGKAVAKNTFVHMGVRITRTICEEGTVVRAT